MKGISKNSNWVFLQEGSGRLCGSWLIFFNALVLYLLAKNQQERPHSVLKIKRVPIMSASWKPLISSKPVVVSLASFMQNFLLLLCCFYDYCTGCRHLSMRFWCFIIKASFVFEATNDFFANFLGACYCE